MDVAAIQRRARTENFPVASLLFPRRLRPHLRAVYGFARLVDVLGDEVEGDRLAALDALGGGAAGAPRGTSGGGSAGGATGGRRRGRSGASGSRRSTSSRPRASRSCA